MTMRDGGDLENVDPDELREWLEESRPLLDSRGMCREHWRNYDTARRFVRNEKMAVRQRETWLPRSFCYEMSRQSLRYARIMLSGVGQPPCAHCVTNKIPALDDAGHYLAALGSILDAMHYRELGRSKWADEHDHPREQWEVYSHPVYDEEAAKAAERERKKEKAAKAKASKRRELDLDIEDFARPATVLPPPMVEPEPIQVASPAWREWLEQRKATRRAELEAYRRAHPWQQPQPPESDRPLALGDHVIMAKSDPSGWSWSLPRRPWLVVECDCTFCARGSHVAIDVETDDGWRHLSVSLLRRKGDLSPAQVDAWVDVMAYTRLGNKLGVAFENNDQSARLILDEVAALALADSLGGLDLTDEQAYQLERWRNQRGGEDHATAPEEVRATVDNRRHRSGRDAAE